MAKSSYADSSRASPKAAAHTHGDGTQEIEVLRKRYEDLNTQKTVAKTNLKNAQTELDQLKTEARNVFGTDDLQKLQRMLEEMIAANKQKRADYQAALEKIEAALADVEKCYEQSEQESQP